MGSYEEKTRINFNWQREKGIIRKKERKGGYLVIVHVHSRISRNVFTWEMRALRQFFAEEAKIRLSRGRTRTNTKTLPRSSFLLPLSDRGLSSVAAVDPNCAVMICISDFINSLSRDTLASSRGWARGKGEYNVICIADRDIETGYFVFDDEEQCKGQLTRNLSLAFSGRINRDRTFGRDEIILQGDIQVYPRGNFRCYPASCSSNSAEVSEEDRFSF